MMSLRIFSASLISAALVFNAGCSTVTQQPALQSQAAEQRLSSLAALSKHSPVTRTLDIQEWRTSAGTKVLFMAAPELPMFDLRLTFAAGSSEDQQSYGLANLTSSMIDEGTSSLDASQIAARFEDLRDAMGKLRLNDASFSYEMETSAALGFGFRCGFLGLLHLEIIRERIEREFNVDIITTAPSVIYKVNMRDGTQIELHNPVDLPDQTLILNIEEPWIEATILVPDDYLGSILKLCEDRRGRQKQLTYAGARAMLVYELPLNEVVFDFYDRLKSVSRGYASFDYKMIGYEEGDLVRLAILVNAEPVDALAMIVHRARAEQRGRVMCEKLKDLIPRHMFQIPIQAAIGGKIVARETLSALRKDVTAKCYGGDISRKRKLLDKQKEGKKKMRQFGKVEIPQEAFISALKMDEN